MALAQTSLSDSATISKTEFDTELERELARRRILDFTCYTKPDYRVNWHHRILSQYLDAFVARDINFLIIETPPRYGKSELVSRRLPAYIFGTNPDAHVIAVSYSADLASRNNRDVQRIIDTDTYRELFPHVHLNSKAIRADVKGNYLRNSDIFEIVFANGSYRSAGVGGGITGMGFDYGIVDDPIKNREEANSPTYRQKTWDWFNSTFFTRQSPNAPVLLTMTPWHEDDIAARWHAILKTLPKAFKWEVVKFPALAEGDLHPDDPREEGEALWPDQFSLESVQLMRTQIGSYEFGALYQLNPKPIEGHRIKRAWLQLTDAVPRQAQRVRYWDKAGTAKAGAYTAGVLMAEFGGLFYIEDVVRGQWSAGEREATIKQVTELDKRAYGHVPTYIEQEPGSGGKESAEATIRNLAGFAIYADRPTGDKDTRLIPFAAQAEALNVFLKRADWNTEYIDEVASIPYSKYRDQGDATSGAFNKLTLGSMEMHESEAPEFLADYRG